MVMYMYKYKLFLCFYCRFLDISAKLAISPALLRVFIIFVIRNTFSVLIILYHYELREMRNRLKMHRACD
jgi:hypothetical protein